MSHPIKSGQVSQGSRRGGVLWGPLNSESNGFPKFSLRVLTLTLERAWNSFQSLPEDPPLRISPSHL